LRERHHLDQDVLAFRGQTEHPAGVRRVDAAEEDLARLRAGARRQHDALDRQQLADREAGFLHHLAPDHALGRLVLLDDPGDSLPDPGVTARGGWAGAELADQDDLVAPRIVEQYGTGVATFENLATDDVAHA